MARPVRSASQKAKELIAAGFNVKRVDAIGAVGLSPEEEDELNDEIFIKCYDELAEIEGDEGSTVGNSTDVGEQNVTFSTFNDVDVGPPVVKFRPSRVPGPHLAERITRSDMNRFTRAIDFFQLLMPDEFMETIVENTNLYAWLNIHDKPSYSKRDGSWNELCLREFKNFLALTIFHGFAGRADVERSWSQATLYSGGWSRRFLSRNRFKALSGMLHVSKPGEEDESDVLAKIRPMLNQIKKASTNIFHPRETLSIDERMVKSKGRSPIRQYMPDKPTRFGYKLWCICDAETGYTFNFNVYVGKRTKRSGNGLGYDVVMDLIEPYRNHGHQVHSDNFFNSFQLAKDLLVAGTTVCGTMQHWRRGFPSILKEKDWVKHTKPGDMRYVRRDGVLFLQWQDKRVVNMISTAHNANDHVLLIRRGKNKKGDYERQVCRKPSCINTYNKFMGGVDLADQMIESYNCLVKVTRWWKTLFFHMIDVAVLNSYILFKLWKDAHPDVPGPARRSRFSHLDFREELVRQLAEVWDDEEPPLYRPALKRKKSLNCSGPHDPECTKKRRNCQVCYILYGKQNKSYIRCADPQCLAHLCLNKRRNCFPTWHAPDFDKYRYPSKKQK